MRLIDHEVAPDLPFLLECGVITGMVKLLAIVHPTTEIGLAVLI